VDVSFAQHARDRHGFLQSLKQPAQLDELPDVSTSKLQLVTHENEPMSAAPIENIQLFEQPTLQHNQRSVPQRRSQGSRLRHKERTLKSFSSHKRKMTQFFQICADETRASFSEKQR
jgi:hypothetical protein